MTIIIGQRSRLLFELTNRVRRAIFESSTRSICTIVQRPVQSVKVCLSRLERHESDQEENSLTMLQNAETAVGKEVLHTCRPTKYVSVFPVMGIPRICVRVTLGISHRYGTKSGKMNPYLWQKESG
jgi:hypothetical protein